MHLGFIKEVSMKSDKLIVGLDIGTNNVCALVGEVSDIRQAGERNLSVSANYMHRMHETPLFNQLAERGVSIIGVGTAVSRGIRKGEVCSMESAADSIRKAIQEAGEMAGVDIKAVHLGITGRHIDCLSSHGVIAVKDNEIGRKDVESVIEAAKAVAIPFDREILHVIPVGFSVNGQNGITDPVGMGGVRLETNVQIITGTATSVKNLIKTCHRAGVEVIDIMFQPLASANAVLTEDEKNLGVVVVDIGAGTTDIAIFQEGTICYSAVLAVGGNNFTNDLAIGLRIPTVEAENIKKTFGCSMISMIKEDEFLNVGNDDRKLFKKIPRRYLVEILQPRAEELFGIVKDEIMDKGFYRNLNSGVVLTGGSVLMEGMDVMAENILELPVRIGIPAGVRSVKDDIYSPEFAAAAGLVIYGAEECLSGEDSDNSRVFAGLKAKMKGFMEGIFRLQT